MRAAVVHVMADATASVMVIVGLVLASTFGWRWIDPLAGIFGACVIASWSYSLIRDTGSVLLNMMPDAGMADSLRKVIEGEGDQSCYRTKLARFCSLSHVTIEVRHV
jgi:cation diffusion facilitator family transporter